MDMNGTHECDVLVIGAGPAGASTALNLAQSHRPISHFNRAV